MMQAAPLLLQSLAGDREDGLLVDEMDVVDKAVATDELSYVPHERSTCVEVARLEAVLSTLVDHKVTAMKSAAGAAHFIKVVSAASPKRLRIASLSTSISDRERSRRKRRWRKVQRLYPHPEGPCQCGRMPPPPPSADDQHIELAGACCCLDHSASETRLPGSYDEDYVSLRIDDCDDDIEDEYEASRRRRKRRKRRRKRRQLRAMAAITLADEVRTIDRDELPPKARWTIVATAGILLFMCLMLVGVTLRMAPLIDDMVRKENEALLHSLHGNVSLQVATPTLPPLR